MTQPNAPRLVRCRYRRRNDEMCTAEVTDPEADILLCTKHLARAVAYYNAVVKLMKRK